MSISPNACIIEAEKPRFVGVSETLKISTHQTLALLKRELEIEQFELEEFILDFVPPNPSGASVYSKGGGNPLIILKGAPHRPGIK